MGDGVRRKPICLIWWEKSPNASTLTLGAVKYLISALVGILLKLALFLKTALKISLFLFLCAKYKTTLPSLFDTELFQTVYQRNLSLKAGLPGTNKSVNIGSRGYGWIREESERTQRRRRQQSVTIPAVTSLFLTPGPATQPWKSRPIALPSYMYLEIQPHNIHTTNKRPIH